MFSDLSLELRSGHGVLLIIHLIRLLAFNYAREQMRKVKDNIA